MSKKKIAIIGIAILIFSLSIGIASRFLKNEVKALDLPVEGKTYTVGIGGGTNYSYLFDPYLYCIEHGYEYSRGTYKCTEVTTINDIANSARVGYAVAYQETGKRAVEIDAVQNLVWKYAKENNAFGSGDRQSKGESIFEPGYADVNSWNNNWSYINNNFIYSTDRSYIPELANRSTAWNYYSKEREKYIKYNEFGELSATIAVNDHNNTQNNIFKISPEEGKTIEIIGGKMGPFVIQYPNCSINGVDYIYGNVTISIGGETVNSSNIVDANGNSIAKSMKTNKEENISLPGSGVEFYIKVNDGQKPEEVSIQYSCTYFYVDKYARLVNTRGHKDDQTLILIKQAAKDVFVGRKWKVVDDSIQIQLVKKGPSDEKVYAKFAINLAQSKNIQIISNNIIVNQPDGLEDQWASIKPISKDEDMVIALEEQWVTEGYVKYTSPIIITLNFDNTQNKWIVNQRVIEKPKINNTTYENITVEQTETGRIIVVTAVNRSEENLQLNLVKKGPKGENVNATFSVVGIKGASIVGSSTEFTSSANLIFKPNKDSKQIVLDLMETKTEEIRGYIKYSEKFSITFNYDENAKKWVLASYTKPHFSDAGTSVEENLVVTFNNNVATITAVNRRKENLLLNLDKVGPNGEAVGAVFSISATNAIVNRNTLDTHYTSSNFASLEPIDISKPIEITLTETSADGQYIVYNNSLKFSVQYIQSTKQWRIYRQNNVTYTKNGVTYTADIKVSVVGNDITITAENDIITVKPRGLSGIVWLDGQRGLKPVQSANGNREADEKTVQGVIVELCYKYVPLSETTKGGKKREDYSGHIQDQFDELHVDRSTTTAKDGTFSFDNIGTLKSTESLWNNHEYQKPVYSWEPKNEQCTHIAKKCVHTSCTAECFRHVSAGGICRGDIGYCDHDCGKAGNSPSGCYQRVCKHDEHTAACIGIICGNEKHEHTAACYGLTCDHKDGHLDSCYKYECTHSHANGCSDNHHDWYHSIDNGGDVVCYLKKTRITIKNPGGVHHDCDDPDSYYSKDSYPCYYCPQSCQDTVGVQWCIRFTYDGVNYIATAADYGYDSPWASSVDSDAREDGRDEFNRKFQTINSGSNISYRYENNNTVAKFNPGYTEVNSSFTYVRAGKANSNYEMAALTKWVNSDVMINQMNNGCIGFGLVKRGVDLATVTDIYKARVYINGEEQIYSYNDIANLGKDSNGNPIIDKLQNVNVTYNLYLYNSDYNYRIGDYELGAAKNDILVTKKNGAEDELQDEREADGDLSVQVMYQVLLNNQSAADARINQIAYYFDRNYDLDSVRTSDGTGLSYSGLTLETVNGVTYNKVIINTSSFANFNSTTNQRVIYLQFTVKKDNNKIPLTTYKNWVEITEYYTPDGLIDCDSKPGNIKDGHFEDDSDDAPGLEIKLNNEQRIVSGFVFEDGKPFVEAAYNVGNGVYDNGEGKINGVIVQLIEIKKTTIGNTTLNLEYIWQETVSGSNTVKYLSADGQSQGTYGVSNGTGEYTFNKDIIPGKYIIRFIYGDGTYFDTTIDGTATSQTQKESIMKYNGQDYKSTIDIGYKEENFESIPYSSNASKARDNEARRLEEMAYANTITVATKGNIDTIDSKEKLDKTWMCADSSILSLEVSKNNANSNGGTITAGDYPGDYLVRDVKFGLVERLRALITVEKHITSLRIDNNIADAIANWTNIDNALNDSSNTLILGANTGAKKVVADITNKNRNNRGMWKVEAEIDKLAGEGLYITYGYRVRNLGDAEYVGQDLINELKSKTYDQIANESYNAFYNGTSNIGKYLGSAYYSGNPEEEGNIKVGTSFQVEDYFENTKTNPLELDTSSDFKPATPDIADKDIWTWVKTSETTGYADAGKENVKINITANVLTLRAGDTAYLEQKVFNKSLDSTSGIKDFTYRSYVAQAIYRQDGKPIVSGSGTLCKGMKLSNLEKVQSYADLVSVPLLELAPERDENLAETVLITMPTGETQEIQKDNNTTVIIIASIIGLGIITAGIVVIKKYVVK